jgi:membrane protein YdbS with pleckstrin-like domain
MPIDSPSPAVEVPGPPAAVENRLDPQFVPFQRAVGWIVTASISVAVLIGLPIVWLTGELPRWGNLLLAPTWLIVTAGIAWLSYTWPVLEYRHTSYTLSEDGIDSFGRVLEAGDDGPRSRVQHTDVSQGPMERATISAGW